MDDYAYINARIRAMQGDLFDRSRYEALAAQETTGSLLESLKDSPYLTALERTAEKSDATPGLDTSIRIDEAFRQDLVRTLSKLRRITSDRPRELMETLLSRWDSYNLKTVLRGKRAHARIEEILASTFPVGVLDEVALAELTRAQTFRTVADTLETWRVPIARPLHKGLKLLEETDMLQPLEIELDRFTYGQAFQRIADGDDNDHAVRDYLRHLVDKTNLLTALRYLQERSALSPIEAGRHFLEANGRLTRAHYRMIVGARDFHHGFSLLTDTPYGWLKGLFAEEKLVSLPRIERQLDRWLIREAQGLARRDPLGIGVAVAYIEQKINEIRNLRMIMQGKVSGVEAEQLTEWLII
jgi:V/A-type H+-transporting ATPase subunit C